MIDSIHEALARVHEHARLNINIVHTTDALQLSTEIAKLRSELGALMVRSEADASAVAALMDAAGMTPMDQLEAMPKVHAALNVLYTQFEDRINAHDKAARFAKLAAIVGEDAARADVYGDEKNGA